mmetsp:Transcript_17995/g.45582  ORF Transcript_17995/g.45582 Transcript_17995/m.45582 type:complete len:95 (+) Transcript_17995:87-371(+)
MVTTYDGKSSIYFNTAPKPAFWMYSELLSFNDLMRKTFVVVCTKVLEDEPLHHNIVLKPGSTGYIARPGFVRLVEYPFASPAMYQASWRACKYD